MEPAIALSPRFLLPSVALLALAARPVHHAPAPPDCQLPRHAAPAPVREVWRPACEQVFDAARRDAAIAYGVHFERPFHPADDPDPDALEFASANGLELRIELAPNDGQAGYDMILVDDEERRAGGWLRQAYVEHAFALDTRELAGAVFIKIELMAHSAPAWDAQRQRVATLLERAGERCQASAASPQ